MNKTFAIIVALVLLALVIDYVVGAYRAARNTQSSYECVWGLRSLERVKQAWVQETGATNGAPVLADELNRRIAPRPPKCFAGGVYSCNPVGVPPTCSLAGDPQAREVVIRTSLLYRKKVYVGTHSLEHEGVAEPDDGGQPSIGRAVSSDEL